jgi:hypothetical protein
MDMKQNLADRLHLHKRTKGETAQLAAQLAPLEEQNQPAAVQQQVANSARPSKGGVNQEVGAIVVDNSPATSAAEITDVRKGKTVMGMEPVALVILVGMLLFIVFITWQVTLLPVE